MTIDHFICLGIGAFGTGCLWIFVEMLRRWGERHAGEGPIRSGIPMDLEEDIRRYFAALNNRGRIVTLAGNVKELTELAASIKRRLEGRDG
jgi:hypothetical protein